MINKKIILLSTTLLLLMLASCAKPIPEAMESNIKTDVAEISKPVDDLLENMKDIKPVETLYSDEELIKKALLNHYNEQFGNTNAAYKTTGYKMYLIEEISPNEKRAYGFANYMEYNLEDGELKNTAGSSPTGIIITFSKNGENSNIDYEILTDSDYTSDKFKESFPGNIQKKILERNENDINEVIKMQEDMLKDLINEK